jgi:hypothetical protein
MLVEYVGSIPAAEALSSDWRSVAQTTRNFREAEGRRTEGFLFLAGHR